MKRLLIPFVIIFLSIFLMGCFGVDGDFRSVRNITLKEFGKNFVTDTEFALGGFEMWIVGGIVGLVESDEMASAVIGSVSGVQVGVYKNKTNDEVPTKNLLKKIDRQMERKGWKFIIKSFEKNEMTAIYINKDSDKMLKELFVISIDNEEMAIVHVSGDLEEVIEAAIREQGIHWNKDERRRLASN